MNNSKTKNENIVVQELEKEILIYNLETNKAFCLNDTSAMIYQLCNGKRTVSEISQSLNKKMKQITNEEFIWLALDQFKRDGLLENNDKFEIDFGGLSRRQIIKKIGLFSTIALPVVSSVLAPSAVMAASKCFNPSGAAAGTFLGGAGGTGFCSDNNGNAGNIACTSVRGNLCCSGIATADQCFDAAPGPNYGSFSVACRCA